ncbi:MAG: gamma-glutamylcyclotransferase family protein [Pseudomonadota bacterium]
MSDGDPPDAFPDRLFVYGSLQPGGPNEYVLAPLEGRWQPASIRGVLREAGWGAAMGYPGLILDANGDEVSGQIFESPGLAEFWPELDAFEGAEYERVIIEASLGDGAHLSACCYVLRNP